MSRRRGSGEGSVFTRKDGRIVAQVTRPDGTPWQRYASTKAEARRFRDEMRIALERGESLSTGDNRLTLGDYLWEWHDLKRADWTYRTAEVARHNILRVTPLLGNTKLAKLEQRHFRELLVELEKDFAPQTIYTTWHTIKQALDAAVEDGKLVKNPIGKRLHPPRRDVPEIKTFTRMQVTQLLRSTQGDRWHAMWVLMALRGLRVGECRGLKWSDIDWENRRLTIRRQTAWEGPDKGMMDAPPKTRSSRRMIWLPQFSVQALRAHLELQAKLAKVVGDAWIDSDYVFTRLDGGMLHSTHHVWYWERAVKDAGLPYIKPHALRHTAATLLGEEGVSPLAIQGMLGHSSARITLDVYSHPSETLHRESAELMDAMFEELESSE